MAMDLDEFDAIDGAPLEPDIVLLALTTYDFVFDDGASQVFRADGSTTYVEHGRATHGSWYMDAAKFCSFWPPSYTGCYSLTWVAAAGRAVGVRFTEDGTGRTFVGRYNP